jgi:hypothetical protein
MAKITAEERKRFPDSAFALPRGRNPIPDEAHARDALARVAANGRAEEKRKVRSAVRLRCPEIDHGKADKGKTS